jgi:predicted DCC family thiol-disulfide oxidoreductase YuxK
VAIVLFDGLCNLCNASVRFILENDPAGEFRFASLQSGAGAEALARFGLAPEGFSSIVLIDGDTVWSNSDAALRIAGRLRSPWPVLALLLALPRPVRDGAYRWIADNRYGLFGKSATCPLPAPEWQARFL